MRLVALLDYLLEDSRDDNDVSLADIRDAGGTRSYGPLIFIPALAAVSPIGVIPLMSVLLGVILFSISAQLMLGIQKPWLPSALAHKSISRDRFAQIADRVRPWLRRVDKWLMPRAGFLFDWPFNMVMGGVCALLALSMIPLGFLPGGILVPGIGLCFYGAAFLARDGLMLAMGTALVYAGGWLVWLLAF